ncbi:RloB domain-containing protein [Muribaculaceae bacterium Isolate-004 (NCI)]|uniref:RloB family protein n=1 Tax=Muribaculum intestinale TaxID=1796646 RepID=UPI000FFEC75D|nr:RloB family protein [Muribaculum intestinale]RXE60987.1 RloB domain-containing protein [Muribaculaceae bacterium Isolate-004 (NCI)]
MARKAKQPRGKKMNPTFFVFCEGKTEAAYVDLLRRSFRVPVEIIARVSDSNISQPYIDRCKRDRFTTSEDKTFLMFDLDVPGMLERLRKIKDAVLLLSNPSIEYWFLLHYKDTNKELSSAECLAMLKGIDADYQKGVFSTAMKKVLIDAIEDAVKRAKSKEAYTNPSSTIHLLTDEITAVKR